MATATKDPASLDPSKAAPVSRYLANAIKIRLKRGDKVEVTRAEVGMHPRHVWDHRLGLELTVEPKGQAPLYFSVVGNVKRPTRDDPGEASAILEETFPPSKERYVRETARGRTAAEILERIASEIAHRAYPHGRD